MSIHVYKELDFKRFLIVLYIISNTEVFLKILSNIIDISGQAYHEFYYNSFLTSLAGTLMIAYFGRFKELVNPLPDKGIINDWDAFMNLELGVNILKCYAKYLD